MPAFTRFALIALSGMSARAYWRKRRRRRATAASELKRTDAEAESPESAASSVSSAGTVDPPVNHFRQFSGRRTTPLVATVAAKSLPVLGLLGMLAAAVLALGALRGELPYLGPITSANPAWAAVLMTITLWAVYLLWKVPQWQAAAWARSSNAEPRELFQIENDSRSTLGQILSGVAVLTGLIFAWQQLGQTNDNIRVNEERQITGRFSSAVEQLGSDNAAVRLGGVYALERIARDSPRDYGPVMEVLTAFARQGSPLPANAAATPVTAAARVPPDVAAVFKVIGRRTPAQVEVELEEDHGCLDLTGISAVGANLVAANLRNTCWDRSDLRASNMTEADFTQSTFTGTDLSQQARLTGAQGHGATFSNANLAFSELSRADFSDANLQGANLAGAILQETNLAETNLISANLQGANLIGTDLRGADLLDADFGNALLTGATLAGAEHLTGDQIAAAGIISNTTLPTGIGPVATP